MISFLKNNVALMYEDQPVPLIHHWISGKPPSPLPRGKGVLPSLIRERGHTFPGGREASLPWKFSGKGVHLSPGEGVPPFPN